MTVQFYEAAQLGAKQSVTPEGFLVCHDVPIARTGTQTYFAHEVTSPDNPIRGDAAGYVEAERIPDEVFRAETIASFEGKDVTLDHPAELVGPANWRDLTVGHVQNVRRGTGTQDNVLLADLLIKDADAIAAVRSKALREVSCGYEATYDQAEPGRAIQRGILGNHLALVKRGRCGPTCAIGDSHNGATMATTTTTTDKNTTPAPKRRGVADKLRGLLTFLDADGGEEGDDDDDDGDGKKKPTSDKAMRKAIADAVTSAMGPVMDKLASLDEDMEELKKKTADEGDLTSAVTATKNPDALGEAWTGDSLEVTLQRAEILAPGGPTFTADGKTVKVGDAVCNCQRQALQRALTADATKVVLSPLLAGVDLTKATYDQLRPLFVAATEIVKARNAAGVSGMTADAALRSQGGPGKPVTVSDAQKSNDDFWKAARGRA